MLDQSLPPEGLEHECLSRIQEACNFCFPNPRRDYDPHESVLIVFIAVLLFDLRLWCLYMHSSKK